MQRSIITTIMLAAIMCQATAAETMIGPTAHLCREVTGDENRANLTLMWVAGYVSGINNLQKPDMLKGLDIGQVIDRFRDACIEDPNRTVLEAARSTVAKLRIDLMTRTKKPN